jgi:hypothetical protein
LVVNTPAKAGLIQHEVTFMKMNVTKGLNRLPREELAAYQLVGGVMAYQDYDG